MSGSPPIIDGKKLIKVKKEFQNEDRACHLDRLPDGSLVNDTLPNDDEGVVMPLVNIEKDSTNSMSSFFIDNAATISKLK